MKKTSWTIVGGAYRTYIVKLLYIYDSNLSLIKQTVNKLPRPKNLSFLNLLLYEFNITVIRARNVKLYLNKVLSSSVSGRTG